MGFLDWFLGTDEKDAPVSIGAPFFFGTDEKNDDMKTISEILDDVEYNIDEPVVITALATVYAAGLSASNSTTAAIRHADARAATKDFMLFIINRGE